MRKSNPSDRFLYAFFKINFNSLFKLRNSTNMKSFLYSKKLSVLSLNRIHKTFENQFTEEIRKSFEKHNIYAVIVRREKFLAGLLGFIWLYLLSFILWTQGFKDYQLGKIIQNLFCN